jgi:hypothetical protein
MAAALMVDHTAKIISQTISVLLDSACAKRAGTVRFTIHIDADANSVHVVPEVMLDG